MTNQTQRTELPNAVQEKQQNIAPVGQLKTNRSILKYILLSIVTFGIYPIVFYSGISSDINVVANRYDGKKTMHYALLFFLIGPLTLGIGYFVWFHKISNRIGGEVERRGINYTLSASTFWLWFVLGSLIIVGPFIYGHKLCVALNTLSEHYNING
ncbi:MAG: DUF4234 domain-containing protein [Oscillospiraceae bacterium]|nr:DUF4234 domain-containing protein [Oscillospiraceae bacterium]MCL2279569.1 DUF4234 domain-containing protein [Oscillospiraceae bacterium]